MRISSVFVSALAALVLTHLAIAEQPRLTHEQQRAIELQRIQAARAGAVPGTTFAWTPAELTFERTKGTDKVDQQLTTQFVIIEKKEVVTMQDVEVLVEDCSQAKAGNGKDGEWNHLFTVRGDEAKADALHKSVKGIGPETALKIVKAGYFKNGKPKSWNDFVDYITLIQKELKLKNLVVNVVANKENSKKNRENLGYVREGCIEKTVVRQEPVYSIQEVSTPIPGTQRTKNVTVNFNDAPLLTGEKEFVRLAWHIDPLTGLDGGLEVVPSLDYNAYTAANTTTIGNDSTVTLKGNRKQVDVHKGNFQIIPKVADNGNLAYEVINADPDLDGNVIVRITTLQKHSGKKTAVGGTTVEFTGGKGEAATNITADRNKYAIFDYTIEVPNSKFYKSGVTSSERISDKKPN